jgi:hypothetical protein
VRILFPRAALLFLLAPFPLIPSPPGGGEAEGEGVPVSV